MKRWLGVRPSVRGSVMNPVDHPHGGGEVDVQLESLDPNALGKPALGIKTRKRKIRAIYLLFVHVKN